MPHDNFFTRLNHEYIDKSERFLLKDRNYDRQFAHIYANRLKHNRESLEKKAKASWGDEIPVRKLSELVIDERCIIIGTLFKQMVYKPNILKELSEENQLEPQPIREKFTDSTDTLILEDELQRIMLVGNKDISNAVTGVTVAVLGFQDSDSGKFSFEKMLFKELISNDTEYKCNGEAYVVLVSGLEIGGSLNDDEKNSMSLFEIQLLIDLLNGTLGNEELEKMVSKITRIIIAGNSLDSKVTERDALTHGKHKKQNKQQAIEEEKESRDSIDKLDSFLFQLSINADVDLMPGPNDPTTFALPQKPLHPCLLPISGNISTLHLVSNPYECKISGVNFLGTSGQPIKDIIRISNYEDELEVLENTLIFGHLAPTAPDTLGCYPFQDNDPFTIDICPDVYFSGNCKKFACKIHEKENGKKTLLITVPSFRTSKTAVLLSLRDLKCTPICIA